jgi:hypothetical protein
MAPNQNCRGPIPFGETGRRAFLQTGLAGFATLSLPGILRLRASAPAAANANSENKAVIMVWQPGGLSHLDSYDPKPDSGSDYRGPFEVISTKVPGLRFTELLPRQAAIADKLVALRSMRQSAGGHPAGSMQLLSGDPDTRDKPKPRYPDWMTVSNYLLAQRGPRQNPLPAYVGINPPLEYNGPAYLGDAYSPFVVSGDPNSPTFSVPNIGLTDADEVRRIGRRSTLRQRLDTLDRSFDQARDLAALDQFESQAMTLLTNPQTRIAFDLNREDARVRDRYGRNAWGQQLLLARRLVEAGVDVLTTSLSGPLCGRVGNWDDHAVNHHVFDAMKFRSQAYDQAVSALIEDIYARGLDKRVMVVVTGEFGRTPRITSQIGTQTGIMQPGRDHWPGAMSVLTFGGGMRTGQVVGATNTKGEYPADRPLTPNDLWATVFQHLGINYHHAFPDHSGRPMPILPFGEPIRELT